MHLQGPKHITMAIKGCGFCFVFISISTAQPLPQEGLWNTTTCDLDSVNVNCSSSEIIALHSITFWYHATCEQICCNYSSSHYSVGADAGVVQYARRQCSGRNLCSVDLEGVREFESVGVKNPSYIVIYYYCIPSGRTTSICSDVGLTSSGSPLYLTNNGYPSVSTGDSTCSCSLEVNSCTTSVNLYMIDADLYFDTNNCEQSLNFADGRNTSLKTVNCENYYENNIAVSNFDTNYVKISFIDDSTADQEGYFFFGFGVSETDVAFKLSCTSEPQSVCFDCGSPDNIPNGRINLQVFTDSSSGALANVDCFNGFDPDTATVSCLDTGLWENATCIPKDCGQPYTIANGTITTAVSGVTTFPAKANVTCDQGYQVKRICDRSIEFQCGDGSCIANSARCDVIPDCPEKLDEILCPNKNSCPEGKKLCDVTCVDEHIACEDSETTTMETNTGTISCLVIGKWEIIGCSIKDCGELTKIENGTITLTVDGKSTYKSTADVTCDTGFSPSTSLISCQADGSWETARCNVIDDENILLIILPSVLAPVVLIVIILLGLYIIRKCRQKQRNKRVPEEILGSNPMSAGNTQLRDQRNLPQMMQQMQDPSVQSMLTNPRALQAIQQVMSGMQTLSSEAPGLFPGIGVPGANMTMPSALSGTGTTAPTTVTTSTGTTPTTSPATTDASTTATITTSAGGMAPTTKQQTTGVVDPFTNMSHMMNMTSQENEEDVEPSNYEDLHVYYEVDHGTYGTKEGSEK